MGQVYSLVIFRKWYFPCSFQLPARKRKSRSASLGRSKSSEMEKHFFETCQNENLTRGIAELRKQDAVQRSAAMLIQLVWRQRRERRGDVEVNKKWTGHTCYTIDAPAYFGESMLWTPLSTWTTRATIHEYTVRVKTQVEIVSIPKVALAMCIDKFSPWMRNRFEVFQAAVLDEADSISQDKESQVSQKPSDLALSKGSRKNPIRIQPWPSLTT